MEYEMKRTIVGQAIEIQQLKDRADRNDKELATLYERCQKAEAENECLKTELKSALEKLKPQTKGPF